MFLGTSLTIPVQEHGLRQAHDDRHYHHQAWLIFYSEPAVVCAQDSVKNRRGWRADSVDKLLNMHEEDKSVSHAWSLGSNTQSLKPGMVDNICNPSTQEVQAVGLKSVSAT